MRPPITLHFLRNTAAGRKIENCHLFEQVKEKKRQARKPSKHVLWMKEEISGWCKGNGLIFHSELKFHSFRKFRFDFAVTDKDDHTQSALKLAIEYHGIQSEKSGHTTLLGFTKDQDKSNLAQSEGWKALAFTILNYRKVIEELEKHLQPK